MYLEKGTFVMKKALYGTTALVAAAVAAGQANAASGLKLGITGFYRGTVGVEFGDSNQVTGVPGGIGLGTGDWGRDNVAFRQEIRVNFTGSTTLDNGITFGVLVGLNAGGGETKGGKTNVPARINRAYMDVSGKFGQIRFGDANSAYQSMCVLDPGNVTANFGLNSPNESFSNAGKFAGPGTAGTFMPTSIAGAGTCYGVETRTTKIIYFSPTFGGFNFAVSFSPSAVRGASGSGGSSGTQTVAGFKNFISAGVNFNHDFGGVTLSAGISGDWALSGKTTTSDNAATLSNKPSMYQAGLQVGFGGGWAVGATGQYVVNYRDTVNGYGGAAIGALTSDDAYMILAGGSYTMDAISIGLEGLYDRFQDGGGGPSGSAVKYYGVSLNGAYALGPGISLEGQFAWTKSDNNFSTPAFNAAKVNSYEIDFGTAINF